MKRLILALVLALAMVAAVGGCGGNACDDATDKLRDECDLPVDAVSGDCDSTSECEADCINEHSCDHIREAFGGTPNAYTECDDACS